VTEGDGGSQERSEGNPGAGRLADRWSVVPDPEPDIPTVGGSEPEPVPERASVPRELRTVFWLLVFLIKFALVAASLGLLLIWFEGRYQLGASLLGLAVVLALAAVVRYRRYRRADGNDPDESPQRDSRR